MNQPELTGINMNTEASMTSGFMMSHTTLTENKATDADEPDHEETYSKSSTDVS